MEIVKIVRAFKPGDVVFIECGYMLSSETRERLLKSLGQMGDYAGIKILLLDGGLKLAAREEQREEVCSQ